MKKINMNKKSNRLVIIGIILVIIGILSIVGIIIIYRAFLCSITRGILASSIASIVLGVAAIIIATADDN